jgi:N-acetylneuraminate synthase
MNIKPIKIGDREIGSDCPPFIIAEIGINHNGSLNQAKEMVDAAVRAGADAVKFQTRTVDVVYSLAELAKPRPVPRGILEAAVKRGVLSTSAVRRLQGSDFENSTNGDLKYALEFTDSELAEIHRHCNERGIMWFTSCWDTEALQRIEKMFDLPCHKVASACNEDDKLLRQLRRAGKPVILSTGMTDLNGVSQAVEILGKKGLVILHCTSVYPKGTEAGEEILRLINLRGMDTLRQKFGVPVGFSSHDSGIMPSYAAIARGACVVEKHFTLERGMWGSDQGSSIEPQDLANLCRMARELNLALGDGQIQIYPDEVAVAEKLRRVRRKNKAG